ncbi:MAG: class I SAM-dependent methyltransferase [Clostridia bacterium]|nr:class I SAM-dependent methyltransferase [Clostridia bacterium]
MFPKTVVTTSLEPDSVVQERARWWAETLKCPLIPRNRDLESSRALNRVAETTNADVIIVVGRKATRLLVGEQEFHFHPSMAKLRVQALARGQVDQLISAGGIDQGSSFLDCTLGLAADAIVASYVAGSSGKVVGLESQALLAALAEEGLHNYADGDRQLLEAMGRIKVVHTQAESYLTRLPDETFDVVYFDPMFRHTRKKSPAMDILRLLGNPTPLSGEVVREALRVARYRVVVKEGRGCRVFEELGISRIVGGKYSPVAYGVLDK